MVDAESEMFAVHKVIEVLTSVSGDRVSNGIVQLSAACVDDTMQLYMCSLDRR